MFDLKQIHIARLQTISILKVENEISDDVDIIKSALVSNDRPVIDVMVVVTQKNAFVVTPGKEFVRMNNRMIKSNGSIPRSE